MSDTSLPLANGQHTASSSTASLASEVIEKTSVADLVAKYGSTSATAWLEMERYILWRPKEGEVPESEFRPVVGYMKRDPYVFGWGNPLVADSSLLLPTAKAFTAWAERHNLNPIWACVDAEFEEVLGGQMGWSTVSCIYEDVIDPEHVLSLANDDANEKIEGSKSLVKDLKKNLRRADRAHVSVKEVKGTEWSDSDKKAVEDGIDGWVKGRDGIQLASTTVQPWLDEEHRRYWIARHENKIVGVIILTPTANTFQIKNAISFPDAPRGTSEDLIYGALQQLSEERRASGSEDRVLLSFGITASSSFKPSKNLSGFRVTALSKTYKTVTHTAGLLKRGDFRAKFDPKHDSMYVCYPDSFGVEAVRKLLSLLNNSESKSVIADIGDVDTAA